MDEMIDVNEREAQGVAIRRQRRRVPFEIINTFLTVICLASAGLVVYKLLQPEGTSDVTGPLPFVIHTKLTKILKGKTYMAPTDSPWVHDGTISAPCDGLYLIYAQVTAEQNSEITVEKKEEASLDHVWLIGKAIVNQTLVTFYTLRKGNIINMKINQDGINFKDAFLGIILLKAQPNMKSCQENM